MPLDNRQADAAMPALVLLEIDPAVVVNGERHDDVYVAEDVRTYGAMRETCPMCIGKHLQLVLRQKDVRLAHLFCANCTRCYDARFADGSSALNY
ncbi:MAG TPA: hypothetical protein DCW29_13645 [Janthinobacterium sp.]|nr:hypothetical protein [Janthinobacterium sp.]